MNENDKKIMEKYAQAIFGCGADDLSEKEERMLIYHILEHNPDFLNHYGIEE